MNDNCYKHHGTVSLFIYVSGIALSAIVKLLLLSSALSLLRFREAKHNAIRDILYFLQLYSTRSLIKIIPYYMDVDYFVVFIYCCGIFLDRKSKSNLDKCCNIILHLMLRWRRQLWMSVSLYLFEIRTIVVLRFTDCVSTVKYENWIFFK